MFFIVTKRQILLTLLLTVIILSAVFLSFASKDKTADICLEFIESLGYHPQGGPIEIAEVDIPEGFGNVYENYQKIQKEAGFDLTSYRGLGLTRYTFRLSDGEYTIANILIHNGKICGGDILNPSIGGNMLPLVPKDKAKDSIC